jgi:spore coat protein A, manganese oxidase
MAISRRQFLRGALITGAGFALPTLPFKRMMRSAYAFGQSPIINKFQFPLPGLGSSGIPLATGHTQTIAGLSTDVYNLGVKKYTQQIPGIPYTKVAGGTTFLGYHDIGGVSRYLGGVIVAKRGRPVMLNVKNELLDEAIIPIDPTVMMGMGKMVKDYPLNRIAVHLHGGLTPWFSDGTPFQWFDPNGNVGDSFMNVPGIPSPPKGTANYYYPMDQSARLVWYHDHAMGITRTNAYCGIASALIITDDFESLLIREGLLPALAGPLDIPLVIQDKTFFDHKNDPSYPISGAKRGDLWYPWQYEANILTGGVNNPKGRWDWGATFTPPSQPPSALHPISLPPISLVPEFFADTILVNGGPYPVVHVPPKRVRFRMLNGSQARFYHLNLYYEDPNNPGEVPIKGFDAAGRKPILNAVPGPFMYQVGTEGGFLPKVAVHKNNIPCPLDTRPVALGGDPTGNTAIPDGPFNLLLAPAERADVIIDFNHLSPGTSFILYSDAPGPFPMGEPRNDYYTGDPDFTDPNNNPYGSSGGALPTQPGAGPNTRTLMKIIVDKGAGDALPTPAWLLAMDVELAANFLTGNQPPLLFHKKFEPWAPAFPFTGKADRMLTLNEDFDVNGRLIQTLGTFAQNGVNNQGLPTWGRAYDDDPTETPSAGATEVWQIMNLTADTHPIHFHLVNVQLIQRQSFVGDPSSFTLGTPMPPEANEIGWKETVRMNPGEVTTVIMKFDLPKLPTAAMRNATSPRTGGHEYVWHCHILEHEEHDMMRPLVVY